MDPRNPLLLTLLASATAVPALAQNCVYLREPGGPAALGQFGNAVAADDLWAAVGAPGQGTVTLYQLNVGSGLYGEYVEMGTLQSPGGSGDFFGGSLDLSGDLLLVGAQNEEKAYLYRLDSASQQWILDVVLDQPIAGAGNTDYGFSVALEEDPGNPSFAYVGAFNTTMGTSPNQVPYAGVVHGYQVLPGSGVGSPTSIQPPTPMNSDRFGVSLAARDGALIVGSPYDDTGRGLDSGSVDVFARVGTTWTHQQTIEPPNVGDSQYYGISVALNGSPNGICVGSENDASAPGFEGAAHVYDRGTATASFTLRDSLTAPTGQPLDDFGFSVAGSNSTWMIGARAAGGLVGAVYEFEVTGGPFASTTLVNTYLPNGGFGGDLFGQAVAIDPLGGVVIGAPGHRAGGFGGAGGAYFRVFSNNAVIPDCNGNGIDDVCEIFAGTATDVNGNGVLDECESTGSAYCENATQNSTGVPGRVMGIGSGSTTSNDTSLFGYDMPPGQFARLVTSANTGIVGFPGGSQGILCLTGSIGRFGVVQINSQGVATTDADVLAWPASTGQTTVLPGDTWHFQYWHRDVNPIATSNFTSAWSVTFN